MKRTCVQCGKTFYLSESEIKFYKDRKLSIPKRCKECREANKKNKGNAEAEEKKPVNAASHEPEITDAGALTTAENSGKTGGTAQTGKKKGRFSFAGAAAAVALLAAGGGIFTHNALSNAYSPVQPQTAYEYTVEADADEAEGGIAKPGEASEQVQEADTQAAARPEYAFRNNEYLEEHYEKHGKEMGFASAEEYEAAASAVVNDPRALHKLEAEDGDDVYYIEETNEFVIVSKRGYLRTYFKPSAGKRYYDKQ
ncbi:MAG: zinc-ribbon domain containing protein [Lachnospiraceae bacterium]|nr:zinc-ribbon domain containing protein [Lachnospiraceae bacterium]